MEKIMANRALVLVSILVVVVPHVIAADDDLSGIVMRLSAEGSHYVIREPVKFRVRFTNESADTLNIIPPTSLNHRQKFISYEIQSPSGSVKRINLLEIFVDQAGHQEWEGKQLPPNESIEIVLYPPFTCFDKPGKYEARVVYELPNDYRGLWRPDAGPLYSNHVSLDFRPETSREKEILDAYWKGNRDNYYEDCDIKNNVDEELLRAAFDTYPSPSITKYPAFLYARTLFGSSFDNADRIRDAIVVLESLRRDFPEFRFEETIVVLGWAYSAVGDNEAAEQLFQRAADQRPELYDLWWFAFRWMWVKTGSYRPSAVISKTKSRSERIDILSMQQPN